MRWLLPHRTLLVCGLLGVLAAVPRVGGLAATWQEEVASGGDAVEYEDLAWSLASLGRFEHSVDDPLRLSPRGTPTAHRTPGFPVFAAGVYRLFGRSISAVRCAQVLLSCLSVPLLYLLCRKVFGEPVGLVTGIGWALWPESLFTFYSSDSFYSEPLAVALLIASVWALAGAGGAHRAILSGALLGLALLTRAHLLLAIPFLVLCAAAWRHRLRGSAGRLVAVALVALLPVVAWSPRNYRELGTRSPSTQSGHTFWLGNNSDARGSCRADWRTRPELQRLLAAHPELSGASEPVKSDYLHRGGLGGAPHGRPAPLLLA